MRKYDIQFEMNFSSDQPNVIFHPTIVKQFFARHAKRIFHPTNISTFFVRQELSFFVIKISKPNINAEENNIFHNS